MRPQLVAAAIVVVVVVVALTTGFVWAGRSVTVVVDGTAYVRRTQAADVAAFLRDVRVSVKPHDLVSPGLSEKLRDDETVVVRHAVPVTLLLGSRRVSLRVVGSRVSDALMAAGLDPTSGLKVFPDVGAALVPGMTIQAADVFLRIVQEERAIPPRRISIADPSMPINTRRVVNPGAPGKLLRVLETVVTGGREGGRALKAQSVVLQPVDTVVAFGTNRDFRAAARGSFGPSYATYMAPPLGGRRLTVLATAYLARDNAMEGGLNAATGARLGYGIIAVDPAVIPFGTRIYVPGYGYGVAADTGGAINGAHVDLCFDSQQDVDRWGMRTLDIVLLP